MSTAGREQQIVAALVELADTLVTDFDVADLLHRLVMHCVDLLEADAAGLLLSDQRGALQVMASSTEQTRLLELFQLQADEGPCVDCVETGAPVTSPDLAQDVTRWPRFVPAATGQGFAAVHALPLRLREEVIGAMNLFSKTPGELPEEDVRVAQALADVATIGILSERAHHHSEVLVEQLQGALGSRVLIEQAKGVLAEAGQVDMDEAFARLRAHARAARTSLTEAARQLVSGEVSAAAVLAARSQTH